MVTFLRRIVLNVLLKILYSTFDQGLARFCHYIESLEIVIRRLID